MTHALRRSLPWLVALAAVAIGILLLVANTVTDESYIAFADGALPPSGSAAFGWGSTGDVVLRGAALWGAAFAVAGLAALSYLIGRWSVRRAPGARPVSAQA